MESDAAGIIGNTAEDEDLIAELLEWVVSPDLKERPAAEQIAMGAALLYRLKEAVVTDPEALVRQANRRQVSPELPQLIGEVVIAVAWAKDAGGTFLQAIAGDWDKRAPGYDGTSSRLVMALRKKAPAELVDRLETAAKLRHFVVHGVWVNGSFAKHPRAGEPYDFVSMKRRYRADAPSKDSKAFMKGALEWLAQEFWAIEDELEILHSEILLGGGEGR